MCELFKKCLNFNRLCWAERQQFQAMAADAVVFIAGGMRIAWCLFEEPQVLPPLRLNKQLLTMAWFIGAVIGAVVSATLPQRTSKNMTICSSGALLMSGGIIAFMFPTHIASIFCGSLLEGCANGLTQVQFLANIADVAHNKLRGVLTAIERVFLWLGICLQLLYTRHYYTNLISNALHVNQANGIIIACLGLVATLLTMLLGPQDLQLVTAHRGRVSVTDVVSMEEAKRTVSATTAATSLLRQELSTPKHAQITTTPTEQPLLPVHTTACCRAMKLLKLMLMRGFVALSMSLPFNRAFLTASWGGFGCDMNCLYLLAGCGLLGSLVGGLLVDARGRRSLVVCSLLLGCNLIFVVGGIFNHLQHSRSEIMDGPDLEMASILLLLFQCVSSAGVGVVSSVYLGEAFEAGFTRVRCIAAVTAFEHILQIGLSAMMFSMVYWNVAQFFFIVGSLYLVFGLLAFFFMPETKLLTVRECLLKFNKVP